MEDLTNQQMILLAILVSFVASIATSVSVVSLLNESPMTITQTVNRIVERTIEKVVPEAILPAPAPAIVKVPANPNEAGWIVSAVETNLPAMVTFWSWKTAAEESTKRGIGFAVSSDGLLVTDKNVLEENAEYSAVFPNGKIYKAKTVYRDENSSIAIVALRDQKDQTATSTPFVVFSSEEPKLGASVAALGGKEGATVYQGIISEKTKMQIVTSILFKQIDRGGPLFGINGKVIGMNTIGADEEKYAIPTADILSAIENYRKSI